MLTHRAATIDPDIPHPAEDLHTPPPGEQLDLFTPAVPHPADTLDEPPPDPYDYPYGFAEDDLAGLDINDLPTQRPPTTERVDDIDIPALRARRHAAHQHAQALAQEILRGGGPAERAAADELAELRRLQHHQRPHQHALAHAHKLWVHAEDTAELHHQLLSQLDAAITAAHQRGDTAALRRYQQHHHDITQQTPRIATAVDTARQRLDTARSALLGTAGGAEGIVTDRHIHTLRAEALHADTQALTAARRHARDVDNQLARAENIAARSFAENPAHIYDLAAELPQLRDEIDYLAAASAASPAALYHPPATALAGLDEPHRHTVTALASSIHTVQPLHMHPGADKAGLLGALAATAHHHNHNVLALPASPTAIDYAAAHRYADTDATPEQAQAHIENQRWKLPPGTLLIVDDADHLPPDQLRRLTHTAATANTKLILITTPENHRQPTHTLLDVLADNLPHTQHIGTPTAPTQPRTAIARAEHHLATTNNPTGARTQAAELLTRRNELLEHLRDVDSTQAQLDAITRREQGRDRDNSHGIER